MRKKDKRKVQKAGALALAGAALVFTIPELVILHNTPALIGGIAAGLCWLAYTAHFIIDLSQGN